MSGLNETQRFLLALGASLLFSLAWLVAAIEPGGIACEPAAATLLDCPTRL